ncbi:GGDEF domain-containing protein [Kineococcus sp. SYSU DK005]|uniref:GGDEF domain-containing protein n=1 Tax=Kineococcus sp. SYSU DK005 TaxID=3383126 RepID=UPI003D7CB9A5
MHDHQGLGPAAGTTPGRGRGARAAVAATVLSLPASAAVCLLRPGDLVATTLAYLVPVVLAVALAAVAVRRVPAHRRRPWCWLLAALVLYLAGELLFAAVALTGGESWPTPADAVYLAAYVPVTLGLLGLDRRRGGGHHRGNLLDASIVTLSAAVLFGVFVVLPAATDTAQPALARLVSTAYPVADVVWVYLLARMVTGPGARTTAFWLLAAGTAATLVADVGNNLLQLVEGTLTTPVWMNLLWQSFYVLYALAACSDSAPRLSEKKPADSARGLTAPRLVALAVAAVLPSAVLVGLAVTGARTPTAWLAAGSVLLVGLVVARIWDLLQQVRSQAVQLAALARTDPLTGAANRRTWDHELSRACAASARSGEGLYVALLDLDRFKSFNDTRGHQAGDELLKAATAAWSESLGTDGFLARWGGEEFAVLLGSADEAGTLRRVDALRAVVPHGQTCSVGLARWDGAEEPAAVLRRADEALYAAKTGGRDRLVTAPELHPRPAQPAAGPAPRGSGAAR